MSLCLTFRPTFDARSHSVSLSSLGAFIPKTIGAFRKCSLALMLLCYSLMQYVAIEPYLSGQAGFNYT